MEPEILTALGARLRHRGADGERQRVAGAVGFSCQHLWVAPEDHGAFQPVVGASGAMLVLDGRLDNRGELIVGLALERDLSDAGCALAAYERWGDAFAAHLAGDFAVAVFDPRARRLLLARDALGVRPLYYFHDSRTAVFASEIKAILAHPGVPVAPDEEGIADFLLVGARPLDRQDLTCFRGISSVIPAHVVTISSDGASRRRYWDFDTERQLRFASFSEYVEAFGERFRTAVARRLRSKYCVAISVSGGLDSSSVFCQAEALRRGSTGLPRISGISYVSEHRATDEQAYLREIETQYGVTIDRFAIEPRTGIVGGVIDQVSAIEAPFVDYMWGVTRELHRRAAAAGARVLLSGHWGDQMLFSSAYLVDLLRRGAIPTIWRHTTSYARYFGDEEARHRRRRLLVEAGRYHLPTPLASLLKRLRLTLFARPQPKPWFSPRFLASALRNRYRLATFERRFSSAHARAVYIEARSKYHVQCMEWNAKVGARHGLDAAFPFLDRDLLAFLMAIPGEVHAHGGVPRVLLRDALHGVLPDSIRARTWKSDFTAFVNQGVRDDAKAILAAMSADCLGVRFGYLDHHRLAPELARLAGTSQTEECTDSWDLADTYGLEMWLRVFWGPDRRADVAHSRTAGGTEAAISHA
jgi:asparagine synthase (glutamine-hydrolysing)